MRYLLFLGLLISYGVSGFELSCKDYKRVYTTFINKDGQQTKFVYFGHDGKEEVLGFIKEDCEIIRLKETNFKINVSLIDRKVILDDRNNYLQLIFPIAPGALNVNETESVTPLFKNAYLDQRTAIEKRTKPAYFKGYPFVRVMTDKSVSKGWTGIGFHIKMNSTLKRTFDSHGCLRMTPSHIIAFDRILRYGAHRHLSVNIHNLYLEELNPNVLDNVNMHEDSYHIPLS